MGDGDRIQQWLHVFCQLVTARTARMFFCPAICAKWGTGGTTSFISSWNAGGSRSPTAPLPGQMTVAPAASISADDGCWGFADLLFTPPVGFGFSDDFESGRATATWAPCVTLCAQFPSRSFFLFGEFRVVNKVAVSGRPLWERCCNWPSNCALTKVGCG